ncbi:MAG: response regulator transcription factor [Candidatus Gastranaerophilales bacterium]|nr:response regulator transcription factor [Candidatus Gastranaerophilales bacterium]
MAENNKLNLLIVEDHSLTLFGLKTVLSSKDFVNEIFEAQTGAKALSLFENNKIDIAIVDLGLPDINGISLSKKIKAISKNTKIIILTSHNNQEEVIESFKNGASAYCSKEIDTAILSDVIEHVRYGAIWIDPSISNIVLDCIADRNAVNEKALEAYNFTSREMEIIKLLVNGYDNLQMSKKLAVSLYTIKAHICNILQKLDAKDRTQAVVKVMKFMK